MTKSITPNYLKQLEVPEQPSPIIHRKSRIRGLRRQIAWILFRTAMRITGNPLKALKLVIAAFRLYRKIQGEEKVNKVALVDGRYYWRFSTPGFPSEALNARLENEIGRLLPVPQKKGLSFLFLGITNKCALKCEHCYEWHNLNQPDQLTREDLLEIVKSYETSQIILCGGEPLLRIKDLVWVLERSEPKADFWVATSGLGLNEKRAQALKEAGLTGVVVALDNYLPDAHDEFRGFGGAFQQATRAVRNANSAGLVTALSMCPAKRFLSTVMLERYMEMAKYLGVSFIQLIEPRALGRFQGQEVEYGPEEIQIAEDVYRRYNMDPELLDYPIINYSGYHQRRLGCFGSGNRFMYIDANGLAHSCPFCHHSSVNVRDTSPEEVMMLLQQSKCAGFGTIEL